MSKRLAAGPVSRIRRVTLQPRKLLKRNWRELSMMSILAMSAGFASHRRHTSTGREKRVSPARRGASSNCTARILLITSSPSTSTGTADMGIALISANSRGLGLKWGANFRSPFLDLVVDLRDSNRLLPSCRPLVQNPFVRFAAYTFSITSCPSEL